MTVTRLTQILTGTSAQIIKVDADRVAARLDSFAALTQEQVDAARAAVTGDGEPVPLPFRYLSLREYTSTSDDQVEYLRKRFGGKKLFVADCEGDNTVRLAVWIAR